MLTYLLTDPCGPTTLFSPWLDTIEA